MRNRLFSVIYSGIILTHLLVQTNCRPQPEEKGEKDSWEVLAAEGLNPKHADGIRVGKDGTFNRDFMKEVLLGDRHEVEMTDENIEAIKDTVRDLFFKADADTDGFVNQTELSRVIMHQIQEHLKHSTNTSKRIFAQIDLNKDSKIAWNEYVRCLLIAEGYNTEDIDSYLDGDEDVLESSAEWQLIQDETSFQAHDEDFDSFLSLREFLHFQHPEECPETFSKMMKKAFALMDTNNDKQLSLEEYLGPSLIEARLDFTPEMKMELSSDPFIKERAHEFTGIIDHDHNGFLSFQEFSWFNLPNNTHAAAHDAWSVIIQADDNEDRKLELGEMVGNFHAFLQSKALHTAKQIHNEF